MKLAVIGTGYVGLVTAVVFADFGHQVWGLDIDQVKIKQLSRGIAPFFEPQLGEFLDRGLKSGRLRFTADYRQALKGVEAIFICVGTPPQNGGQADLSYVRQSAESIAENLSNTAIIVLKSTVPPGVHRQLTKILDGRVKGKYRFASVPEFLREGSAIADSLKPARIVIGAEDRLTKRKLLELHAPIGGERVLTDIVSAQMVKYAANAFLATKISFANGVARVCDGLGADVEQVMKGVGLDPRIRRDFLYPGLGYGGSCFPKDVKAFAHIAEQTGEPLSLLEAVDQINETQVAYVVSRAKQFLGDISGKTVAMWGLAFKPNTDDLREARSGLLIDELSQAGAKIKAYDPVAGQAAKKIFGRKLTLTDSAYQAAKNARAVFLVTEWNEFKKVDLAKVKRLMSGNLLVDGRNLYQPEEVRKAGLRYLGVGRR